MALRKGEQTGFNFHGAPCVINDVFDSWPHPPKAPPAQNAIKMIVGGAAAASHSHMPRREAAGRLKGVGDFFPTRSCEVTAAVNIVTLPSAALGWRRGRRRPAGKGACPASGTIASHQFCRSPQSPPPPRCLQPARVIHHADVNYIVGSSKTKTRVKGLSAEATVATPPHRPPVPSLPAEAGF